MRRFNIPNLRFKKRLDIIMKSLIIIIFLIVILSVADYIIEPTVKSVAKLRAESLASNTIDKCVTEILEENNISYSSLVNQELNSAKEIKAIFLNTNAINRLKSKLSININEELSKYSIGEITIPLGTFSGLDFLSDVGPKIDVSVNMTGNAHIIFKDSFIGVGVNQTQHRIILEITAKIYIFFIGHKEFAEITNDYIVAETMIIGNVPQSSSHLNIPQK